MMMMIRMDKFKQIIEQYINVYIYNKVKHVHYCVHIIIQLGHIYLIYQSYIQQQQNLNDYIINNVPEQQ